MREPKRILLIKLRALGDVILSTPVAWNLRQAFPKAHIAFLTEDGGAELLKDDPAINEVIVFPGQVIRTRWGFAKWWEEWRFIAHLRTKKFDWAIDLFGNPRSAWMTFLSGAKTRVGFAYHFRKWAYTIKVPPKNPQYVVDFNLDALRVMEVPALDSSIRVYLSEMDKAFAEDFWRKTGLAGETPVMGLFPGGGWESKRWGLKGFAKVGDALKQEFGAKVLLIGGKKEEQDLEQIAGMMEKRPAILSEATLGQLAAVTAKLAMWIGNDSGPKYLAVAFGVPTVTIFGPTDAANATPPGGKHLAVMAEVPCLVCNQTTCPFRAGDERHQQCMKKISSTQVMAAVRQIWKR
jgi:lipopolysaccharide heptosyltransferase II